MSKPKSSPLDSVCPVCRTPVSFNDAKLIEQEMDEDNKSCVRCCMTFGEVRAEFSRPASKQEE